MLPSSVTARVLFAAAAVGFFSAVAAAADGAGDGAGDGRGTATVGLVAERPADGPAVKTPLGYMTPYEEQIPGTGVRFTMIPVPGGVVSVGDARTGDGSDQGFDDAECPTSPPMTVRVEPLWVGKFEVRWAEYRRFMELDRHFQRFGQLRTLLASKPRGPEQIAPLVRKHAGLWKLLTGETTKVDAVTAPTALYDPSTTYESGEDPDLPAVTMTPYAARQYTKWLSAITGRDYRLPSEAEWEHAARGGGGGPYGSGAGGAAVAADSLGRHAWTADNSDFAAQTAGGLAPNAWGLHDMLGNAAEWVLDGPRDSGPAPPAAGPVAWADAVAWPTKAYPRIAKGGHWDAAPADCRVASRTLSEDADWKASDPNYPKSPWWYSDYPATAVGFRVVRPLREMDEAMRRRVWEVDHPDIQADVDARLEEGRGKQDRADQDLPAAIKALSSPGIDGLLN